jgi:cytochrome P450
MNIVTRETRTAAEHAGTGRTWQVSDHGLAEELIGSSALSLEQSDATGDVVSVRSALVAELHRLHAADPDRIASVTRDAAREVLAGLPSGEPVNLKWRFAIPVADRVFATVMGVPVADVEQIRGWCEGMFAGETHYTAGRLRGLGGYISGLIDARSSGSGYSRGTGGDWLTRLLGTVDVASMPRPLLASHLAWLLTGTGWDLTHPIVSTATLLLLTHPAQRDRLAADPALWPRAMDEVFRLFDPSPTAKRYDVSDGSGEPFYVKHDLIVDGAELRRGDVVRIDLARANRDPGVFPAPDTFDVTRAGAERIAWERPGRVFPAIVFTRAESEACLRALFDGRTPTLADPDQAGWLDQPMRLRTDGLTVRLG